MNKNILFFLRGTAFTLLVIVASLLFSEYRLVPRNAAEAQCVPVSPSAPGTICGLGTNGCGWPGNIDCNGVDPECGCPSGYERRNWLVSFGNGSFSFCGKL